MSKFKDWDMEEKLPLMVIGSLTAVALTVFGIYGILEKDQKTLYAEFNKAVSEGKINLKDCKIKESRKDYILRCNKPKQ